MQLIFNEISFLPLAENEHIFFDQFLVLLKVFDNAKKLYGFKDFVFPENISTLKVLSNKSFYEWVNNISHQGAKNKILSVVRKPFISDVIGEQAIELPRFYYVNLPAGILETYCTGLATAYINGCLCASISSTAFWDLNTIEFQKIINDNLETEQVSVFNISNANHFELSEIKRLVQYSGNVQLIETDINPVNKSIALRDDHGKDKLLAFSKKIILSNFIISVINSLPFNSKAVNFIHKIYTDGKIELVLYWEDKGIGIIIQTTGRNFRETEAIAKILKNEFDK